MQSLHETFGRPNRLYGVQSPRFLRAIIEQETNFDDRVPMWRREVQRDALPNLTDDELVRVVAGGHIIHIVDVAERDNLRRFGG